VNINQFHVFSSNVLEDMVHKQNIPKSTTLVVLHVRRNTMLAASSKHELNHNKMSYDINALKRDMNTIMICMRYGLPEKHNRGER